MRRATGGRPVLARTRSDREGRFQIDVPAEKDPRRARFLVALWAYAPNEGLAAQAISPSALPAPGSVQLKLAGPAQTAIRVVGPDGKPVAGARVAPVWVRVTGGVRPTSTFPPPDSLADLLAATTDAAGTGELHGCRAEDIEAVLVQAVGFGHQGSVLSTAQAPTAPGDHTQGHRPADGSRSDQ